MFQAQKHKYVKYNCSMETVQKNGRFTLFFSKFPSNIYSIRFGHNAEIEGWEIIDDLDILYHEV